MVADIKIEKNIPTPSYRSSGSRRGKVQKYDDTILNMEIGDSFKISSFQEITNVRNCIAYHKDHTLEFKNKKFITRLISGRKLNIHVDRLHKKRKLEVETYRVWRTK